MTSLSEIGGDGRLRIADLGRRGVPDVGDPGRAARELTAGLPPRTPSLPDHVLAEYSTADLDIRAASVRGLMHRYRAQPRQDAFSVSHDRHSDTTVVVVSDGVGSLPRSHEAAYFVADRLPAHFWEQRNWDAAIKAVNAELQELVERTLAGVHPDERDGDGMATTVVAVAFVPGDGGRRALIARSDDSTVWWLGPDRTWSVASADQDDAAVHTGSVRALPAAAPRLHHTEIAFEAGALFVMTDGVGVPLAQSGEVQRTLASWWSTPPTIFEFGSQVGFARKTHMDDRTVVGVWLRPPEAERADGLG